jgi:hypothetical protein
MMRLSWRGRRSRQRCSCTDPGVIASNAAGFPRHFVFATRNSPAPIRVPKRACMRAVRVASDDPSRLRLRVGCAKGRGSGAALSRSFRPATHCTARWHRGRGAHSRQLGIDPRGCEMAITRGLFGSCGCAVTRRSVGRLLGPANNTKLAVEVIVVHRLVGAHWELGRRGST